MKRVQPICKATKRIVDHLKWRLMYSCSAMEAEAYAVQLMLLSQ